MPAWRNILKRCASTHVFISRGLGTAAAVVAWHYPSSSWSPSLAAHRKRPRNPELQELSAGDEVVALRRQLACQSYAERDSGRKRQRTSSHGAQGSTITAAQLSSLSVGAWTLDLDRLPGLIGPQGLAPEEPAVASSGGATSSSAALNFEGETTTTGESAAAGQAVIATVRCFFEQVSPNISKALAGLGLLMVRDAMSSPFVQSHATPVLDDSQEQLSTLLPRALRYMRIASSAYGPLLVNPVMFPNSMDLKDVQARGVEAAMWSHAGLDDVEADVLCERRQSSWLRPSYVVVHDRSRREVVIAVRGTLSLEDVATDLGAEEVPFFGGGTAHGAILRSAANVLKDIAPALEKIASDVDKVTFTGHSLGAAVAVYLTWLFAATVNEPAADMWCRRAPLDLRCFSFGSPGVHGLEVARSVSKQIVSFSNGYDIVPRLSFGAVVELHNRAVAAADAAKAMAAAGRLSAPLQSFGEGGFAVDTRSKLCPAGRNIILTADGECREVDPEDAAAYIWVGGGPQLLFDHFPPQYESSLKAAIAKHCAESTAAAV